MCSLFFSVRWFRLREWLTQSYLMNLCCWRFPHFISRHLKPLYHSGIHILISMALHVLVPGYLQNHIHWIESNCYIVILFNSEDASATQRDTWTKSQETNLCGHALWPLYRADVMVKALDMEWENFRPQKFIPTFLSVMRLIILPCFGDCLLVFTLVKSSGIMGVHYRCIQYISLCLHSF